METVLEFKCACACQLEPAERKGGDGGGRAPSGTKAVCGTVLAHGGKMGIIIPAETFSTPPSPKAVINLRSSHPSPTPSEKGGGTKNESAKSVSSVKDCKLPNASDEKQLRGWTPSK